MLYHKISSVCACTYVSDWRCQDVHVMHWTSVKPCHLSFHWSLHWRIQSANPPFPSSKFPSFPFQNQKIGLKYWGIYSFPKRCCKIVTTTWKYLSEACSAYKACDGTKSGKDVGSCVAVYSSVWYVWESVELHGPLICSPVAKPVAPSQFIVDCKQWHCWVEL